MFDSNTVLSAPFFDRNCSMEVDPNADGKTFAWLTPTVFDQPLAVKWEVGVRTYDDGDSVLIYPLLSFKSMDSRSGDEDRADPRHCLNVQHHDLSHDRGARRDLAFSENIIVPRDEVDTFEVDASIPLIFPVDKDASLSCGCNHRRFIGPNGMVEWSVWFEEERRIANYP
jgi:hypothetical protein